MCNVGILYKRSAEQKKKSDVVIVDATAITEDGGIIPGASIGASPELIKMADKARRI